MIYFIMILYKVKEVVLDQAHNPLLLLVDMEEHHVLPVGIGFWEAQAIILKLQGGVLPRPMTHDLMSILCQELGAQLNRIVITDIYENTFYAELCLIRDGEEITVDARPSDAIALALTTASPIYISRKVSEFTISIDEIMENKDLFGFADGDSEDDPPLH